MTVAKGKFFILFIYILEKEIDNPYKVERIDETKYMKTSSYINTRSDTD